MREVQRGGDGVRIARIQACHMRIDHGDGVLNRSLDFDRQIELGADGHGFASFSSNPASLRAREAGAATLRSRIVSQALMGCFVALRAPRNDAGMV